MLPKIVVEHVWPPIPDRRFDFMAFYHGEDDEMFDKGWGRTEPEAVVDLLENYPRGVQCERESFLTAVTKAAADQNAKRSP